MISVFQSWTSIGTLVGTVIDNATWALPGKQAYLIPLGVIYIVPVLMSIGLFFIPESPRWLALMDRNELALKSLVWMRPHTDNVPEELEEIRAAIKVERDLKSEAAWMDVWRDPVDRRRTLLAIAAVSIQAASGAMFIIGTYHPKNPSSTIHLSHPPFTKMVIFGTWKERALTMVFPSLRHLLLQNGRHHRRLQNVIDPHRRRRRRHHHKQLRHLQDRASPRVPHGRHEHLRHLAVHHRRRVPERPGHPRHRKSTCPIPIPHFLLCIFEHKLGFGWFG